MHHKKSGSLAAFFMPTAQSVAQYADTLKSIASQAAFAA
jgi:hypothetical protein